VHSDHSSVPVIRVPDAVQLSSYTTAGIENNKMLGGSPGAAAGSSIPAGFKPMPVPLPAGDPSPSHSVHPRTLNWTIAA
jgi:hypothetical protein